MSKHSENVILEIENTSLKCNKKDLILHSDYFKAMFEGNFEERNMDSIKLEGIDLQSMKAILILLWDQTYIVDNKDILMVLQTACMLQFASIREICISQLTEILSRENCVQIWFVTESLYLKPIFLKAKNMALMEFDAIKFSDCLLELNLKQLHEYLADIHLNCCTEMDVFNTCMRWFYENSNDYNAKCNQRQQTLLSLLSCIDFKSISDSHIKEIMTFPDIHGNTFIIDVLNCIIDKRNSIEVNSNSEVIEVAGKLLMCRTRSRQPNTYPLFFVKNVCDINGQDEICYDNYKRRKKYKRLDKNAEDLGKNSASLLLFDRNCDFLKCIDLSEEKVKGNEGFQIVGHKKQIFMFGGEVSLGSGHWNSNFWVYDIVREKWERKTKLPFGRRHFVSCVVGNYLYIIAGVGNFRILQENMFWYNYKENIWSKQIMLPYMGAQTYKCCSYKDQLFLLNINNECGLLFVQENSSFINMKIINTNKTVSFPDIFTSFSLFSYDDRIFIKGSSLIELEIKENEGILLVKRNIALKPINCDTMESVVCKDMLYTLYKCNETKTISIEVFSLITFETIHLLESSELKIDQSKYFFGMTTKLFSLQHHYKVEDNIYVNNLFL